MRTAEEHAQFKRTEFLAELGEVTVKFPLVFDLFSLRLGFGQFNHDAEVFELPFSCEERLNFFAERTGFVNQLLRLLAIVPESVLGHLGVEFAEAFLQPGDVKETSADGQVSHRLSLTAP